MRTLSSCLCVALLGILSISVTQSSFADIGGWLNRLVPASWTASAAAKGVPAAIMDAVGGRVQFLFGSPVSTLPHVKEGRLRLLAVTTARRFRALPDVPTIAEAGVPGYEFTGWMGLLVPARVPPHIVESLYAEVTRIVKLPDVTRRLQNDAAEPVGSSPAEFAAYLKSEVVKWTKVVKDAGIRVD